MLKDAVSTGLKANDSLSIALFGYDIHELLLHDDDAANRKVTHKLLDVRIAECGSADFILTGLSRNRNGAAKLAVHLADEGELIGLDGIFGNLGPLRINEVALDCDEAELFPECGGDVRSNRVERTQQNGCGFLQSSFAAFRLCRMPFGLIERDMPMISMVSSGYPSRGTSLFSMPRAEPAKRTVVCGCFFSK